MSVSRSRVRTRTSLPDWLPRVILWPSLFSVLTHGALLLIFATTLRSCHQAPVGFGTEASREVGIVVKQPGDNPDAVVPGEPNDGDPNEASIDAAPTNDGFTPTRATEDKPPVETSLPSADGISQIGPGVNLPLGGGVQDPRQPVKSGTGLRPSASGTPGGVPGAAFMGTRDQEEYAKLVAKQQESSMATNLENQQQGAQFRVIDPPSLPDKPAFPDRFKFSLAAIAVGLALAVFFGFGSEILDDRIRNEQALNEATSLPVLVEIPPLPTPREIRAARWRPWLAVAATVAIVILLPSAVAYVYFWGS